MKINFISQFFNPEPTIRDLEFIKLLKMKGSEITVITGFPNYPYGKTYDGYRQKIFQSEKIDGIDIKRLPLIPSRSKNVFMRSLNVTSFFLSLTFYLLFFSKRSDVSYAYHPPITIALSAMILKWVRKIPFVIDVLDLWPHSLVSTNFLKNKFVITIINFITKLVYQNAEHIVVTSPGMKKEIECYGIPANKISIIYNSTPEQRSEQVNTQNLEVMKSRLTLLYAGNIGPAQDIDILIDVAKDLSDENYDLNFIFIGTGILKEQIVKKSEELKCVNVTFLPHVDVSEIWNYFSVADVGIVKLSNDKLFRITIPGKTMSYMFYGLPVLMAANGDAADLINKAECGITCDPSDRNDISNAIKKFYNKNKNELADMGSNGKSFYAANLSTIHAINKFFRIFERITLNEKNI